MSWSEDTGAPPAAPAPRRRRMRTYLRYHVEPHHVRTTQRREMVAMLEIALEPLPADRASQLVMNLAADVLDRGLEPAISRFVDAALPVILPPEDAP